MPIDQEVLDELFPTVVRYVGVLIVCAVAAKLLFFGGIDASYASLLVAAGGMIFYKEVHKSARRHRNGNGGENDERWSHLP